ncbi:MULTISPECIES: copper resistance CopC family protein [Pseudonocardiaceae]|uniref:Uncharacterized protein n=5 Tax=Pseudonocardiaceae TaxID=2070 RepID=A0A2V4AHY2_9PSEU|nr:MULTISPECIES: copper resistance CopC family protein [Pseudonocardiaceae]PXY18485.1 hypothetical protein BAY59_34260 [Prauserella coralliicola]AXB45298.1 hypothetical protein A4R43_24670 [Amycolatopsis albispora]MBE1579632.1 methionine-rich copper-binding protein CopC [Amycolatopsis roodepoortensis]MBQ0925827.1 copper resistance protein CopC [Saccharopolyspora endophytica]OLT41624.1 hypothetical protein BJF85_04050 [Saccharomonospora sp. CUA-673]
MTAGNIRRATLGILAALLCASLLGTDHPATATPSSAVPLLEEATPPANAVLTEPVDWVYLTFDRLINTFSIRVTGPNGHDVARDNAIVKHDMISQPLHTLTQPGTYRVTWQVIDLDGHQASGSHSFTITPGVTTTPENTATTPATTPHSVPPTAPPATNQSTITTPLAATIALSLLAGLTLLTIRHRRRVRASRAQRPDRT